MKNFGLLILAFVLITSVIGIITWMIENLIIEKINLFKKLNILFYSIGYL
ncbi:MAG: hypothetical protein GZ094_23130 [Mariniphaga sp.]|nr:hypothetical protein [Mariniphaga sp.]